MSKSIRRRGFTLPEVLVTITIVAVLAAVVVPAVLNQISKGDTAGLGGDIAALRNAVGNFTTDIRKYPKDINNLIGKVQSTDDDLFGVDYGDAAVNAWKGPYFPTNQDTTDIRTTGYLTSYAGLTIDTDIEKTSSDNGFFITLVFTNTGVAHSIVAAIDRLFDSGDGTVLDDHATTGCAAGTDGSEAGNIRWTNATAGTTCTVSGIKWRLLSASQ